MDSDDKGSLSVNDVLSTMKYRSHLPSLHNSLANRAEVENFFVHLVGNRLARINFEKFLQMVLVRSHVQAFDPRELAARGKRVTQPGYKIKQLFSTIVSKEVKLLYHLDKLKNVLLINCKKNLYGLFRLLDGSGLGEIVPDE